MKVLKYKFINKIIVNGLLMGNLIALTAPVWAAAPPSRMEAHLELSQATDADTQLLLNIIEVYFMKPHAKNAEEIRAQIKTQIKDLKKGLKN
ncbi:MAG: hypothetical protein LBB11_02435, partial [Puniceicoccales bacterium]|nr:hypothetical protein [Puniceicoccales bacterium]